eukprot:TRINITY_DN2796_c0_g1_i1.p3 TRINITY_DN2796_c0_g1~~TRINITY_DN2796_c0_g1_i1.p3  ORF type:complete len:259 (-),score=68.66 TRINITY_DN2796_c0_g1_i1:918-1694(-)
MIRGGNDKAQNYFQKNGLEIQNISDYTSPVSLKYKNELQKVVEKELNLTNKEQEVVVTNNKEQQVVATAAKKNQETMNQQQFQNNLKSTSSQQSSTLLINQIQKPKMQSQIQPKGKIAGKKMGDFDFNCLSNADNNIIKSSTQEQLKIRKTSSSLELSNQETAGVQQMRAENNNHNNNYNKREETKEQYTKFSGQTSLSSAQLFGEQLESSQNNQDGYSLGQYIQMDSLVDYATTNILKLKQTAGNAVERIKQWKNQA